MSSPVPVEPVLDSSGVLAVILEEPGHESVAEAMNSVPPPRISSVNFAEVVTKLAEWGNSEQEIRNILDALDLRVEPFDADLAYDTGLLRPSTRSAGLSLGDRACIALAVQLGARVITTDGAWSRVPLPIEVVVARPMRT